MQIAGGLLFLGGVGLLVWFWNTQRAYVRPTPSRRSTVIRVPRRRRVRFDRALALTAPAMAIPDASPFVLGPGDRASKRLFGLFGLILLIAVVAVAVAAVIWGLGNAITRAISGYFQSGS